MHLTLGPCVGWSQGLSPTLHNPFAWILSALVWLTIGSGILLLSAKKKAQPVRRTKAAGREETPLTETTLETS